jgi:hypothetical protein
LLPRIRIETGLHSWQPLHIVCRRNAEAPDAADTGLESTQDVNATAMGSGYLPPQNQYVQADTPQIFRNPALKLVFAGQFRAAYRYEVISGYSKKIRHNVSSMAS